jgi:hypothetical protein
MYDLRKRSILLHSPRCADTQGKGKIMCRSLKSPSHHLIPLHIPPNSHPCNLFSAIRTLGVFRPLHTLARPALFFLSLSFFFFFLLSPFVSLLPLSFHSATGYRCTPRTLSICPCTHLYVLRYYVTFCSYSPSGQASSPPTGWFYQYLWSVVLLKQLTKHVLRTA